MIGKRTFVPNELAKSYITNIMETGRVSYGTYSRQLEGAWAAMNSVKYGVLSNSGTSSLQVAVQALKEIHGWPDGAEVIVPSLTFVATINVVLHNRLKPVLVDVDPLTYNMDPSLVEDAITDKTVCIMPVHLFGLMADMSAIFDIAFRNDLLIVEDSCESVGAYQEVNGTRIYPGEYGHIACFSFYMAHHIQAGVGGISITDDKRYASKMRSLVNHGMVCDTLDGLEFDPSRDFVFESVGHSFRITEFEAALALSQVGKIPDIIQNRNNAARALTGALSDLDKRLQLPFTPPGFHHSFMMYPIVMRNNDYKRGAIYSKEGLRQSLHGSGIGTREMLPIIEQPVYQRLKLWDQNDYPVAKWIGANGFYVGLQNTYNEDDVVKISEVIHDHFK